MGGNPNPTLGQIYGGAPGVGGFGYNPAGAALQEAVTDNWINQNIPGGVNSKFLITLLNFQIR